MRALIWQPGVQYNPGDVVMYQDRTYKNIQGHRSQSDWAPDVVPALWGAGEYVGKTCDDGGHYQGERLQPPENYGSYSRGMGSDSTSQHKEGRRVIEGAGLTAAGALANRYQSSSEWIEDSKRRFEEFRKRGPTAPTAWILVEVGHIPQDAIMAGEDSSGIPQYIARNFHEGGLHIGRASHEGACLSYGGCEIPLTSYEVLIGDARAITWVPSTSGDGTRPVEAGYEADGKPLWIAQARYAGGVLPGKASGWDSGAYVAHNGKENRVMEYNVLVTVNS